MAKKQHIVTLDARFTDLPQFHVNRFVNEEATVVAQPGMGLQQGFNEATNDYFEIFFEKAREYVVVAERERLEHEPNFRQILPYTLLAQNAERGSDHTKDRFTVYQRTEAIGEARLGGNYSIGAGGHIDLADLIFDPKTSIVDVQQTVLRSLLRELIEEFIFIKPDGSEVAPDELVQALSYTPAGFIRDDANTVGRVHLGLVNIAYVPTEWTIKVRPPKEGEPAEHLDAEGGTAAEILSRGWKFENWSQILLEEFAQVGKLVSTVTAARAGTIIALTDFTDTVDSLVAQFDVSQEELLRLNPILQTALDNGGQCEGGWRLWITDPDAPVAPVDAAQPGEAVVITAPLTYVVKDGETFESICTRFGVEGTKIALMNQMTRPIRENDRLFLKVPEKFMIRVGDTVESIAYRFGLDPLTLTSMNFYGEGEVFMAGRLMRLLPSDEAWVAAAQEATKGGYATREEVDAFLKSGEEESPTDESSGLGATILGTIGRN